MLKYEPLTLNNSL